MLKIFKKIDTSITDMLFPKRCLSCSTEGSFICEDCLSSIKINTNHSCPVCEKVTTPKGKICLKCKTKTSIDGTLCCYSYKDQLIKKSVHILKYRFVDELGIYLGELMVSSFIKNELTLPDMIIPIPLHSKRLRWRGFNQSLLLAKELSKKTLPGMEIPIAENNLIRTRNTPSQMKIKDSLRRLRNIKGAFAITNKKEVRGKNILLVDDIATTGSTLFECAKVLKKAGAKEVFGIIIARQG